MKVGPFARGDAFVCRQLGGHLVFTAARVKACGMAECSDCLEETRLSPIMTVTEAGRRVLGDVTGTLYVGTSQETMG